MLVFTLIIWKSFVNTLSFISYLHYTSSQNAKLRNENYYCSFPGLKVDDQRVAYATRFSAVRLKNNVWSHHRALKAKVQCDFSSAHSPDHSYVLRLINIIDIRYNITRHKIRKLHHFSLTGVCCIRHL